jgi:hypothetical protein
MNHFHTTVAVARLEHEHRIAEAERFGWQWAELCPPRRSLRARLHRTQPSTTQEVANNPAVTTNQRGSVSVDLTELPVQPSALNASTQEQLELIDSTH